MGHQTFTVSNGPLEGQVHTLELDDDQEFGFLLDNEQVAIYRSCQEYTIDRKIVWRLRFVAFDPFAQLLDLR